MAPRHRWSDPIGAQTITTIVKKLVPQWKDGLYPAQLNLIVRILDGEDLFCIMATGGGKSALFAVPIVVLKELASHPELYPNLPARALPVGIVVTPTKGLAANIVFELKNLGVSAFPYCQETVSEARIAGRNLVHEIRDCKTWNVICVDPEHLRDKAWRQITAWDVFRANTVYGCTDEAHLIDEWGADFRPDFKHIGPFFRGRLPSSASIMALSATVQPGAATKSICSSLGFSGDGFHLFRSSNERPNTQLILEPLTNGVGGKIFPQLLSYLNSGRKAVIHCRTIDDVLRVFLYLWKCLPPGPHRLQRIKMYHSLRTFEENQEILRQLEEDPECQAVIATVAIAQGLNVKSLLDSLTYGMPDTVDTLLQEIGRVGRGTETAARGVVFFQPASLTAAQKQLAGPSAVPTTASKPTPMNVKRTKKPSKPLEHAKVLLLTEKTCYNAAMNRIYGNPPLSTATLDCIAANRPLPCSLCATRNKITLEFPAPPLPPGVELPPFVAPAPSNASRLDKKLRLAKKEKKEAASALADFGKTVYRAEHNEPLHQNRPKSSFFPTSVTNSLLDHLLDLDSLEKVETIVALWKFGRGYLARLYAVIHQLRTAIIAERERVRAKKNAKRRAGRRAKRAVYSEESESEEESDESESSSEEEEEEEEEVNQHPRSSPIPPAPKRTKRVLREVTNTRAPHAQTRKTAGRAPRQPQLRAAQISESYAAPYRTSRRRQAAQAQD
ncbi:P-loop containing nucleoside triphosphate hydrolase protein [Mycena galopus ATCC 62051]|nr:P-loop containing nucleoside triphosphate hydrolase protein [Mycena galopus ATCC 62051]